VTAPQSASFSSFASLVAPLGGEVLVIEAGIDWTFPSRAETGTSRALVWGRAPLAGLKSFGIALRYSLTRDRVLGSLRRDPPPPYRSAIVHVMPPPSLGPPGPRSRLRRFLLGGAAAVLSREDAPTSAVDESVRAAGATGAGPVRPRSGGGVMVEVSMPGGGRGVMRIGRPGEPSDPEPGARALERLARDGVAFAPRPMASDVTAGASWSAETALEGARPARVGRTLSRQVARFLDGLPASGEAPAALADDLVAIGAALPNRGRALGSIAERYAARTSPLPGVLRHGDLWAGNLLVVGGKLTGVVDWDAWHPSAVPGADLLHLLVTEERRKTGRPLGAAWKARPWRSRVYAALSADGLRALGVRGDEETLEVIGLAWWAGAVAGTLARLPHRAADHAWLEANVDPVLRELSD
jgi:hypothetical protein